MRLVEDCWQLNAANWQRRKLLCSEAGKDWASDSCGKKLPITYQADGAELFIQHAPFGLEYAVPLDSITTPFGEAIYFLCPIMVQGAQCRRRCRLLHMPPSEGFFGCRQCHRLTYRSSQDAGKRARAIRQTNYLDGVADILDAWL
jgi:hypothetical protein